MTGLVEGISIGVSSAYDMSNDALLEQLA